MLCSLYVFPTQYLECLRLRAVVVVYGSGGQLVRLCLGLVLAYLSNSLLALAVPSLSGCKLGKGREELGIGKVEGKVKKAEKE